MSVYIFDDAMDKIIKRRILKYLTLFCFSIFLTPQTLAAQNNDTLTRQGYELYHHAFTESYPSKGVEVYTKDNILKRVLDNGMTAVIHQMPKVPIASIELIIKTGSATEDKFTGSGISHLVEHMLFKVESEKEAESYNERIKSLGGYINGFTSHDYTGITVTVSKEYVIEALKILKEIISSPSFDALELKKEKEVILDEIRRQKDDPAALASELSWALVFQEHPYRYPIIGHEDLLENIGKKEMEEYFLTRYSPHNMILTIAGDVNKDRLFAEVNEIFGPFKRKFLPAFPNIIEPLQLSPRRRIEYKPISLAHAIISYRSVSINDANLYPLDILAIALGRGEDSILTKKIRDEKKLVHYISCQNYTLRDGGIFNIYFIADSLKADDATKAVLEELEKIKTDGISEANLEKSKNIARAELVNVLETVEGRAGNISISETIAGDYNFSQLYLTKLLDVTVEEIKSAANNTLKADCINKVIILPEQEKETSTPVAQTQQFARKIVKEIMPNGIKILISEDRSAPLCAITAIFLGGVRAENSTDNGITYLVSKLLLDGTKKRSEEDLKAEIESRGGDIGSIGGNNSFGITVKLLSSDWQKGIELISDAIMNSEFDSEKIEKEKNLALAAIKERDDSVVDSGLILFKQNFFGQHPYRLDPLGTEESLQNIARDDILRYYKSLCVPSNMILAIAGDIDADAVILEVKKQFSSFKGLKPKLPKPPIPEAPTEKKEITKTMEREQSLVIVGFQSVKLTDNDRYAFEVIDSIMSGGNGRMFNNIRDVLGMAYALGSSFVPGIESGYYIFYALTSRQNIESVKHAILKEIKELREKGVKETELEAAKKYLITMNTAGLQKNIDFGLKISLDELYGLGYNNFEVYSEKINSVTASQIKRVVNQYFDLENCLIVLIYGGEEEKAL